MRLATLVPLLPLAVVLSVARADAGVREPAGDIPCEPTLRSSWGLAPGPLSCQHRFRADGALDELRAILTLRDCFDTPLPGGTMKATLAAAPGSSVLCGCEPLEQIRNTDLDGVAHFSFRGLGGRGTVRVSLTLVFPATYPFPDLSLDFTSPDQNGSCEPGGSTTVIDLGIWAAGLSVYRRESDFDCNGTVNVVDLGLWAGGLGRGCP